MAVKKINKTITMVAVKNINKTNLTQQCMLSEAECVKLDVLRLKLWDNSFKVRDGGTKISETIDSILELLEDKQFIEQSGEIPVSYFIEKLKDSRNTAEFLSKQPDITLKDYDGKEYGSLDYWNNIIARISKNCSCKE